MTAQKPHYERPSWVETRLNQAMGKLAAWGLGPSYMVQLIVRGRKSGKRYATPVNLLAMDGKEYLVAPRGATSWVRNARAAGEVILQRGRQQDVVQLEEVENAAKAPILKDYVTRYRSAVQRYFTVQADADVAEFAAVADTYPVFRIIRG